MAEEQDMNEQKQDQTSTEFSAATGGASAENLRVLENIEVQLAVEVGNTEIKIRDLLRLNEGSVIELDRLAGDPLDILVNGTMIAKGEIVMVGERFGVRFTEIVDPEKRVESLQGGICLRRQETDNSISAGVRKTEISNLFRINNRLIFNLFWPFGWHAFCLSFLVSAPQIILRVQNNQMSKKGGKNGHRNCQHAAGYYHCCVSVLPVWPVGVFADEGRVYPGQSAKRSAYKSNRRNRRQPV